MNRASLLVLLAILTGSASDVTGPAGTYTVTTTGPTKVTSGPGWVRIEWGANPVVPDPPTPSDPPVVTPPINPPPVVTPPTVPVTTPPRMTGQVFLLAVYDVTKAGTYPPAQQAILLAPSKGGSATIGTAMKVLGISWQPREINDPMLLASSATSDPQHPDKITTWKGEALKQGVPCVIAISDEAGKVTSWTGPLPTDEAAAIALGKQITGK